MILFIKPIHCSHMLTHHIPNGLGFEHFHLVAERQEQRNQLVVGNDIDADLHGFVIVVLRGMKRFVLHVRVSVGGETHHDMFGFLALRDRHADHIVKVGLKIQVLRLVDLG